MAKRDKPVDWAGIERDYCSGSMGIREMARWYGVTDTAIRKKAKADAWVRHEQPRHIADEPPAQRLTNPATDPPDLADQARGLTGRMMDELDTVTSMHGELEEMICSEESDPRRRQALLKALSLSERANTLKNLSATLKVLNEAAAPDGKKAQRQDRAEAASSTGKFAAPSAPKLVVSNR